MALKKSVLFQDSQIQRSDDALLARFADQTHDSDDAFRELVARHAGWLYAAAYRQLRDRHAAEDAAQAVFILLARRAPQVAGKRRISGWLFITLCHTVRAMKRAERRRLTHEAQAARQQTQISETPPPLSDDLDAAVARLSADDRTAILLRFHRAMSLPEISAELGISTEAARKRVARAVARLRQRLGPEANAGNIGLASAFGAHPRAELLGTKVSEAALSAASGSTVPAGIAAAAKGATILMAISKAKLAVGIIAGLCAIGVVTTAVVSVSHRGSAKGRDSSDKGFDLGSPASFEEVYGLKGQAVRCVSSPPFNVRSAFMLQEDPSLNNQRTQLPGAMIVTWRNGKPDLSGWNGWYTIHNLIERIWLTPGWQLEGDPSLMSLRLSGDIVVDRGATPEQLRAGIEKLAREQLGEKLTLAWKEVERPVIVLKGTWKYSPVEPKNWDPARDPRPMLEMYVEGITNHEGAGRGSIADTANAIADEIEQRVVIECDGAPKEVWLHSNSLGGEKPEISPIRNPDVIIRHIEEQTGLKASKETRKVRVLFLERQK